MKNIKQQNNMFSSGRPKAFTLVELIVVITILAILSTIAFISLQGFSRDARDSTRISDLKNIEKALELHTLKESLIPEPADKISIMSGSTLIGYQGYMSKDIAGTIGVHGEVKDPLDDTYYTYSTNANRTKYQLLGFLENNPTALNINLINRANASTIDYISRYTYTVGNNIGIILKDNKTPIQEDNTFDLLQDEYKNKNYIVIFSNLNNQHLSSSGNTLVQNILDSREIMGTTSSTVTLQLACNTTLPSYDNIQTTPGLPTTINQAWQNTDSSKPCYWNCNTNYTWNSSTSTCVANTQSATCGTIPANSTRNTATTITQTWNGTTWTPSTTTTYNTTASTSDCRFKCNTNYTFISNICEPIGKTSTNPGLSCNDIKTKISSSIDGTYWIKPDSNPAFQVYCDMTTDGGGWTLVMKFKSNNSVFTYDSSYWSNDLDFNQNDLNLNDNDFKSKTFSLLSGNTFKFCIDNSGLKCNNITYNGNLKTFISLNTSNQIGYESTVLTGLGVKSTQWIQGFGFSSNGTPDCEGHAVQVNAYTRIGLVRNDGYETSPNRCYGADYSWGFGLKNSNLNSQGGAGYVSSSGSNYKRGYIFVK